MTDLPPPPIPEVRFPLVDVYHGKTGEPLAAIQLDIGVFTEYKEGLQEQLRNEEVDPSKLKKLPPGTQVIGYAGTES